MKKLLFLIICCVLLSFSLAVSVYAYSGSPVNLTFSSSDVNARTKVPNGMSSASIPSFDVAGAPYRYSVVSGRFGKEASDEVFSYTGEQNGDFISVGGYTASNLIYSGFVIPSDINGLDGETVHLSFEMAREGFQYGGYIQIRPRHKDYTSGTNPYFSQGQIFNYNSASNKLMMFGEKINIDNILSKNWSKFDYVFYTKYTPEGTTDTYTAVDVYYNGTKVIDKKKLDADRSISGDQIMTGILRIEFVYSLAKVNGIYPRCTTYIDNVLCKVEESEPEITPVTLSHDSFTVDNLRRRMTNTDSSLTVSALLSGLPDTYDYAFSDASGRILPSDSSALTSRGNIIVKDKSTGNTIAYYYLEQEEFDEEAPVLDLSFSSSDINPTTKIPNGMVGGNVPLNGTENSPYSYGLESGVFGKTAADESFGFTTKWDSDTFVQVGNISAANLRYSCFNINPNITLENNDLIYLSLEVARDGFEQGLAAEVRPRHKDYTTGAMPYFSQGNFLNCTNANGIRVFGVFIDAGKLPMQNWNKFDYVFFPSYNDGTDVYTAVDVYFNNIKILNKLKLDADSKIDGDQLMNGLLQIRFMYSPVMYSQFMEAGMYPMSKTIIDNLKCGVVKRAPVIEPITLSHPLLYIDNERRIITDTELGITVEDLIGSLSSSYDYEAIGKNGDVRSSSDYAYPGYLRVLKKGTDEIIAIYSISAQTSTYLTSDVYTVIRDSINGYEGMSAQDVLDSATVSLRSTALMYNEDGTEADLTSPAKKGMYIRVTAIDNSYEDYVLNYEEQRAGEIIYMVDGMTSDGFSSDASVTATVTIDGYSESVSKDYTLSIAQYKDGRLVSIKNTKETVSGKISKTIELTADILPLPDTSVKIFLWDGFMGLKPIKSSCLIDDHLAGKVMVNFGDSITGQAMRTYDENIEKNTGIQAINLGIGGARMANIGSGEINCLSMAETIKAMTTPGYDWSAQNTYSANNNYDFIKEHIKKMQSVDISKADMVSIWFGTNDFNSGAPPDNSGNLYDTYSVGGALRYSIEKLLEANPDMKILVITPTYRDRQTKYSDNPYLSDEKNSDDFPNSKGIYMTAYVEKIKEVAQGYDNVKVIDMYTKSGIDRYNYNTYLWDGLHPGIRGAISPDNLGYRLVGSKLSDFIVRNF